MTDRLTPGDYAGTAPGERIDPLELICEMATSIARSVIAIDGAPWAPDPAEIHILQRARRVLLMNAYHVPLVVDEALELALNKD